jgi:hypothetical protein
MIDLANQLPMIILWERYGCDNQRVTLTRWMSCHFSADVTCSRPVKEIATMYHVEFTEDVETLVENEASLIAEIVTAMGVTQRRAFDAHRHASRDAYAKSH